MAKTKNTELEIIELNFETNLKPTPELEKELEQVKIKTQYANQLLVEYRTEPDQFMEKNDEATIQELIDELSVPIKTISKVDDNRKQLKKKMKEQTDAVLEIYDNIFKDSGFEGLKEAQSDLKKIKNELQFRRKEKRWSEIKPVFEETILNYPNIAEFSPKLTEFTKYQIINNNLVSGAKTQKPSMKTVLKKVRENIADWSTAIDLIKENTWGLNSNYQMKLLEIFNENPSTATVLTEAPKLKETMLIEIEQQKQAMIEAQRREEEIKRKAEEQKQLQEQLRLQQLEAQAKQDELAKQAALRKQEELQRQIAQQQQEAARLQQEYQNFIKRQINPGFADKYPTYVQDLFKRTYNQSLHGNDRAKANELYHIMTNVVNKDSVVYKATAADPGRVLELVRFVLDM